MTRDLGGAKVYLKREDLNHTGAHKINNVLGQALLAKKMGKTRVIAETGRRPARRGHRHGRRAHGHGVRGVHGRGGHRAPGAERLPHASSGREGARRGRRHRHAQGRRIRDDARMDQPHRRHPLLLGSVMGPHPFPTIVRDFQAVISAEIKEQFLEQEGDLPDAVIACVGGGSNAIGTFYHFIDDKTCASSAARRPGRGVDTFETAATIATGRWAYSTA